MTREKTRSRTRYWITLNYLIVAVVVFLPLVARMTGPSWVVAVLVLLPIVAVLAWSHDRAFGRTGLWSLTHTKPVNLDERERAQAHSALANAYQWISIAGLVAIYLTFLAYEEALSPWLTWIRPIVPVLAIALVYVAHTLPAALLGWKELPPEEDTFHPVGTAG